MGGATNRKRALIVSGSVILLCLTVVIGMTSALFTDVESVGTHLRAGDLDITLTRTKLTSTYLDDSGYLATYTDTIEKDFTGKTDENIFAANGAIIVPQSKYIAEMKVENNSDVAFAYWIEIIYTGEANVDLANQIQVTVDTAESKLLNEGLKIGSESNPVAIVPVGQSHEFTATAEFLNLTSAVNNTAQGDDVTFDIVIHAVQYTG